MTPRDQHFGLSKRVRKRSVTPKSSGIRRLHGTIRQKYIFSDWCFAQEML